MTASTPDIPPDAVGLEPHPISKRWRPFTDEEFAPFLDDVARHGVIVPVVIYEGMILDGVHRATAAELAGMSCPTVPYTGAQPERFAAAMNDRRRQQQAGELALEAAGLVTTSVAGGGDQRPEHRVEAVTVEQAAASKGLSRTTVSEARTVVRCADPELIEAVRSGETSISDGARRARAAIRARDAGADKVAERVLRGDMAPRQAESLAARYERYGQYSDGLRPHPASYSAGLIPTFAALLEGRSHRVLDIFAGKGGIHELGALGPYETVGVELEPEWAMWRPETLVADATDLPFEDDSFTAIATSPAYGNRMSDYDEPPADAPERRDYVCSLGRPLSPNNAAGFAWDDAEYMELHEAAWAEAVRVLAPGGVMLLNVVDHWEQDRHIGVAGMHLTHLVKAFGPDISAMVSADASGWTAAANGDVRIAGEWVVRLQF